tara:strand:- start:135 stop:263 length:129 start_codon:yes stop_codon:yes gene_type:complete
VFLRQVQVVVAQAVEFLRPPEWVVLMDQKLLEWRALAHMLTL